MEMRVEFHMTPEELQAREEYLAIRKEAALKIDPTTAEICKGYGQILDPYGVYPETRYSEGSCYGKLYFARSPGSDIWVWFNDLPADVHEILEKRRFEQTDSLPF